MELMRKMENGLHIARNVIGEMRLVLKYVEPIDNGYEEEFAYLEDYYRSATNANIAPEDYMSNLSGILSEYKVADRDKIDCAMNYKSTIDGTNTLDVSMVDRVFKLELEFTVSGTKEVTFEKEIWVVHEGGYEVPFEYKEGEEPSFEHIIIDPAYIVENVKESEN